MAKISLNLDERSVKNGMAHIRIRINHKKSCAYVSTGIYVEPQYFISGSLYDPIHRKARLAAEKREQVASIVKKFEEWLAAVDRDELLSLSAKDIKERVCGTNTRGNINVPACIDMRTHANARGRIANDPTDFIIWFREYGDGRRSDKTRKSYEYAWNVLMEYCTARRTQTIYFSNIDYSLLTDFARWLRETGRGESTRHMIESYVRAAYKEAQRCKMVGRDLDPYFDYSISPVPQKDIDYLTPEQLRKIAAIDLSDTSGLDRARDCAMMSFYLCGANLLDIFMLDSDSIQDNDVVFVRHKVITRNQRAQRINIEPALAVLMDKYKGKNLPLRFAESTPNYDTFQSKTNKLLKDVSKKLGFKVTMALIRRSWSSIAGMLEIPDRVIDKSMGHMDRSVKDRHYEQYDWSRTAKANRKVIDFVFGNK